MKREIAAAQMKRLQMEERRLDMHDTKQRLLIDKIYALKAILVGAMIDSSKSYSSEVAYLPMMDKDEDVAIVREKIMELVKKM